MTETEAQKRERILHSERKHGAEPKVSFGQAVMASALSQREPIDAPFRAFTAHPSKWFAPRGTTPTSVVIHCTAAENPAAATAAFFASPADSGSTQAVADDDQGFTCVPDNAVCAGVPPLNQEGLHVEFQGAVERTREQWLSHDTALRRVANHVRGWCDKYDIPTTLLHAADLRRLGERARGITYHAAVSEAFHESTHTDPQPNFPWDVFMAYVTQEDDDMAILTDDEQLYLRGVMRFINTFGPPADDAPAKVKEGYTEAREKLTHEDGGPLKDHKHVPGGVVKS